MIKMPSYFHTNKSLKVLANKSLKVLANKRLYMDMEIMHIFFYLVI